MSTQTNGRSVNPSELKTLWEQAKQAGFTNYGLRAMLSFLGIEPKRMSHTLYTTLLPFVKAYNAPKF